MELRQLELFLAVMDSSSVTRAAGRVYLSPGAVSQQMHHLAEELGTELFVRSGRALAPTPAALRLAEYARGVIMRVRQIEQEFANQPASDPRPFRFATGATTLIYRLGPALRQIRQHYPQAQIEVKVAPTEEIVSGLLDRRFDLGLISLPYEEPGIQVTPLFDEELLVLQPAASRCANQTIGQIAPAAVASVPFVVYPRHSNMRTMIEKFFAGQGVQPRVVTEADDTEAIKGLVEAGFGYSMLPESAVLGQMRYYRLLRIAGHKLVRRKALATAKTEFPRALTKAVAVEIRESLAQPREAPARESKRMAKMAGAKA